MIYGCVSKSHANYYKSKLNLITDPDIPSPPLTPAPIRLSHDNLQKGETKPTLLTRNSHQDCSVEVCGEEDQQTVERKPINEGQKSSCGKQLSELGESNPAYIGE